MLQQVDIRPAEPLQRVNAAGRLAVRRVEGRSRVAALREEGAAKIRMPRVSGDPLEAILINTAGGLTGGDRLSWEIEAGERTSAVVTTQTCEKVYRTPGDGAELRCRLTIGAGARLAWLPQETIVFDRSAFSRRLDVDLAPDAEALIAEATVFGRLSMGEQTRQALFHDRWRVRRGGALVHAEDFAIGPEIGATLSRSAATGGFRAMATVLLVSDAAADRLDAVRRLLGANGAASAWSVAGSGKLLARIVAADGYSLRRVLVPLLELLNGQAGLPKVWSL